MAQFREATQSVLYEAVAAGRDFILSLPQDLGIAARDVFAGDHRHLTDPERIRKAGGDFELATVMNEICPHFGAVRDVFRVHALGKDGPYAAIQAWGGFEPTIVNPPTAALVQEEATSHAIIELLARRESKVWLPGEDRLARARDFLQANFTHEEIEEIREDLSCLDMLRRAGWGPALSAEMRRDPDRATVLEYVLELADGLDDREAMLELPSTMAGYAVPLGDGFDSEAEVAQAKRMVQHEFQSRLRPVLAFGEIAGNHRLAYDGNAVNYLFHATRPGAQRAADILAPLPVHSHSGGEPLTPAPILF